MVLSRIGTDYYFSTTNMKNFLVMFRRDCLAPDGSYVRYQFYTKMANPSQKTI